MNISKGRRVEAHITRRIEVIITKCSPKKMSRCTMSCKYCRKDIRNVSAIIKKIIGEQEVKRLVATISQSIKK